MMKMLLRLFLVLAAVAAPVHAGTIRINGSATFARALQAAAPVIKEQLGVDLAFDTQGGSTVSLYAIAEKAADLALVTREITPEDRAKFPSNRLFEVEVGVQALVPIVSRETWESGVKSIKRDDFVALYEGDIRNWKQLGGEDREVKFYNPEAGHGVWELFVTWLYGDVRKAPLGKKWEKATSFEMARDSVEFNRGSIAIAPPRWADGKRVIAIPVIESDGTEIAPTPENFHSHKWPITRPLILVTADRPTGVLRKVVELMVREDGQKALIKTDFIPRPDGEANLRDLIRK